MKNFNANNNLNKSEMSIKKELGIEDWKDISSKENFIEYLEKSHKIDKELHMKIISQIPNYLELAEETIDGIKTIAEKKSQNTDSYLNVINNISNNLSHLAKKDNLSTGEIRYISDKMIELTEILNKFHERDTDFWKDLTKVVGGIGAIALSLVAIFLGCSRESN